jgi:hypothetical protein
MEVLRSGYERPRELIRQTIDSGRTGVLIWRYIERFRWWGPEERTMSIGIIFFTIWFVAVAAYLVWQFAHNALAAQDAYDPEPVFVAALGTPAPAPVVARGRFDRLPLAS